LELTADGLTTLLADFANLANLPSAAFKKVRVDLPSFSTVKWTEFAREHGLPFNASHLQLASFATPRYRLPPSLHEAMFENAWRWQDVYREKVDQGREEARVRVRLLEPVCQLNSDYMRFVLINGICIVPIVALFQGRVIDELEQAMVETQYLTGGDVEHEVSMIFHLCNFYNGYFGRSS
jgi:hypothetical protein